MTSIFWGGLNNIFYTPKSFDLSKAINNKSNKMDLEKLEKERQRIIKVQTEALAAQGHLSQQSLENL